MAEPEGRHDYSMTTMSDETYQRITEILQREVVDKELYLDPQLTLTRLARHIATNRTYMSSYFRVQHSTFWEYINRLRCQYAQQLLQDNPDINSHELAFHSGYKTDSCLRSSFKYFFGMTPNEYGRSLRTGEDPLTPTGADKD